MVRGCTERESSFVFLELLSGVLFASLPTSSLCLTNVSIIISPRSQRLMEFPSILVDWPGSPHICRLAFGRKFYRIDLSLNQSTLHCHLQPHYHPIVALLLPHVIIFILSRGKLNKEKVLVQVLSCLPREHSDKGKLAKEMSLTCPLFPST